MIADVPRALSEYAIARDLAEHCCERITRTVIAQIQGMDAGLLGGDTGLRDLWEELCVQVQYTESRWWRHYKEVIGLCTDGEVEKLQPFEREAVWLLTPEGDDWDCEDEAERDPYPVFTRDIIDFIVHEWVLMAAGRWSSPATEAFIDRASFRG